MSDTVINKELFESVVKIHVVTCAPNYSMPWNVLAPRQSTSSGFIIENNGEKRILCTAHGVVWSKSIRVSKHGNPEKYNAQIEHISHDTDLAILLIKDEEFWVDATKSLSFNEMIPELQDTISLLGYPTGGKNICVTKGVVSRVSCSTYTHGGKYNLVIQIDAAINSGVSGGPAIINNKVVGVAFQSKKKGQNIGYCVPVSVVKWFLNGINKFNNKVPNLPVLAIHSQLCENEAMQRKLNMRSSDNTNNNSKNSKNSNDSSNNETSTVTTAGTGKNTENTTNNDEITHNEEKNNDKKDKTDKNEPNSDNNNATTVDTNASVNNEEKNDDKIDSNESKNDSQNSENNENSNETSTATTTATSTTIGQTNDEQKTSIKSGKKTGVYITRISPLCDATNVLKVGDVLLSYNDTKIANDGTIKFRFGERISYTWLQTQQYVSDECDLQVLRNGNELSLKCKLGLPTALVPYHLFDKELTYYVFGGLVFLPLSANFLRSKYGSDWTSRAPVELVNHYYSSFKSFENEEIVILAHILPNPINDGYHQALRQCPIVKKCNDIEIENTKHLASIIDNLDENETPFVTLQVTPYNVCIMDVKESREKLSEILKSQNIAKDRSQNLVNDDNKKDKNENDV